MLWNEQRKKLSTWIKKKIRKLEAMHECLYTRSKLTRVFLLKNENGKRLVERYCEGKEIMPEECGRLH